MRLVLRFYQSPGDVLMGTAALRDLHAAHPGRFQTAVQSPCPDLWMNNPNVAQLTGEVIRMQYPLVNGCNARPLHFVNAYRMFLADCLGLEIPQGPLRGDIHPSRDELCSPQLVPGEYWIINAGGKNDFTCKLWPAARWQAVVDALPDIRFVQVGEMSPGHLHPPLLRAIDLRGRTTLRELMLLTHHARGVLCGVTMQMHLSAALPMPDGSVRPCVVVAGAREPQQWEAYAGHRFLHNVGQLPCNQRLGVPGGCWRSRIEPLGDGHWSDEPDRICVDVVSADGGRLPHCMEMITPQRVIEAIRSYGQ